MTRRIDTHVTIAFWAGLLIVSTGVAGSVASAQTTASVKVDCGHGQRISTALGQHPNAQNLTVEIQGMCNENVVITRDGVTLTGTDPMSDGIQAATNTTPIDAALWVRSAHQVTVQNLKLTGGFAGLLATETSTPHLRVVNCRLEGNTNYGVTLESSLLQAEDTVFTSNNFINAAAFLGSRFQCTRCTLSDPGGGIGQNIRTNLLAFRGADVVVANTTFANGGVSSQGATVIILDSTISGFGPSGPSVTDNQGTVNLIRVQVSGPMQFLSGSNSSLSGVTQTSTIPNSLASSAFVRVSDASPVTGGPPSIPSNVLSFILRDFSNLSLTQTSQITGNLNCAAGANAFCVNAGNVSGSSNCALCPKP